MVTPFANYQNEHLSGWCKRTQQPLIVEAIARSLDAGETSTAEDLIGELALKPVGFGERHALDANWTWPSTYTVTENDLDYIRGGYHPGDQVDNDYEQYVVEVNSGGYAVSTGSNGGPTMDSNFLEYSNGRIRIRAANDRHRDEMIRNLEVHAEKANVVIANWNTSELPRRIEQAINSETSKHETANKRRADKEAAGFAPAPSRVAPAPLVDKRQSLARPKTRTQRPITELTSNLTASQFEKIVGCIRDHALRVESNPGSGAPPAAGEDDHRDQVLDSLNIRFGLDSVAVGEAFVAKGKTDIHLNVQDGSRFIAECKIWSSVTTVTQATEQLLTRYLTYRDRYGALIFFVRGKPNIETLLNRSIERLTTKHGGSRVDDVSRIPTVKVPNPQNQSFKVDLALIFIAVESAPSRKSSQ